MRSVETPPGFRTSVTETRIRFRESVELVLVIVQVNVIVSPTLTCEGAHVLVTATDGWNRLTSWEAFFPSTLPKPWTVHVAVASLGNGRWRHRGS